ncbi:avidin/streptavidin family protein [Actinomycetospora lutea]|uniref:avidin/streptavidin family protein n=1 Tax=Actinomycetospora lutea TaxID=663604 RepID=UPI00236566FC|nr:avidin/streptavidin family protein [Actinomycetospora lutea]MDD7939571.1 avidin/streptavidin family protein [Actinomycetospora lutea]
MGPEGTWRNELGATMTLIASPDGLLTGTYESHVGRAAGCYRLAGRFDPAPPEDAHAAVGWTVVWNNELGNAHSVTTWCGRYDPDADLLHATWLLTAEGAEHTGWCSTRVGQDLFVRLDARARHEGSASADAASST